MKKKQYKALMLDLDGTTIPNASDGFPSRRVTEAIKKAAKKIHVGVVTGRPFFYAEDIVQHLGLSGPSIAGGGTMILESSTGEIIKESVIPDEDVQAMIAFLKKEKKTIWINGKLTGKKSEIYNNTTKLHQIRSFTIADLDPKRADKLDKLLNIFPSVSAHKIVGWIDGTISLQVTPTEATKQHGILEVAELLQIQTHEIIGVGDGYNDFPLLMACGLKVAMGNAVEDLKAIADYVAPTVEEDGVADVIEKFIL